MVEITQKEKTEEKRKIGTFSSKTTFSEKDDGKVTMEEFLGECTPRINSTTITTA